MLRMGLGIGIVASMAFDPLMDKAGMNDAAPSVRVEHHAHRHPPQYWLRGYIYAVCRAVCAGAEPACGRGRTRRRRDGPRLIARRCSGEEARAEFG